MMLSAKRPSRGETERQQLVQGMTDDSAPMRRLSIEIEDSLHRRIQIRAAEEGRTVSEITRQLWVDFLCEQ